MPQPLISVALCTYNGARFLAEQLDSVLAQTYPEFEVVAVDDGSRDDTVAILRHYQRRDPRIRVFQNPRNLGFVKNFERASQLSWGELLAPCDQDDIWHPEKLARLAAARGDAALVYCDSLLVDETGLELGLRASDLLQMVRGSAAPSLLFGNCVSGHALLCTRELVTRARPFPERDYHDWWLALVAAATNRIEYVDECLVKFRQHAGSATDMIGRRGRAKAGTAEHRLRQLLERVRRIALIAGPAHAQFFGEAQAHFEQWQQAYFSPGLAGFVHRHRHTLFASHRRRRLSRVFDYFFGLRLKRYLRPSKYAALARDCAAAAPVAPALNPAATARAAPLRRQPAVNQLRK